MSIHKDDNAMPIVEVCYGPECSDCDGRELAEALKALGLNMVIGDCRDQCPNAPLAYVNHSMVVKATVARVQTKVDSASE